MQISINIVETSVNLGQPVTVNYVAKGFHNTVLNADCLINPIDLGADDQVGTIKFLPIVSGTFSVTIIGGLGETGADGLYFKSSSAKAEIQVK